MTIQVNSFDPKDVFEKFIVITPQQEGQIKGFTLKLINKADWESKKNFSFH